MNLGPEQLQEVADEIETIIGNIEGQVGDNQELLDKICEHYQDSGKNLLHYTAFRSYDIRELQKKLKRLGLSRLANAEGNILGSLINAQDLVGRLGQNKALIAPEPGLKIGGGKKRLKKHTNLLFGGKRDNRRVKIMVTLPTEAAHNYNMVLEMVRNGMDCARINCAHDDERGWKAMVDHVKLAAEECGVDIKIAMDLAGLKIRTGPLEPGPKVRKFKPQRSALGAVTSPAEIVLVSDGEPIAGPNTLPIPEYLLRELKVGDALALKDTRGKLRKLTIVEIQESRAKVQCDKTLYAGTGTKLYSINSSMEGIPVMELPRVPSFIPLQKDDLLIVAKNEDEGSPPKLDKQGNMVQPARISCIPSVVVDRAKQGEPILFDDGKIEGIIENTHPEFFLVRITKAGVNGSKLKAEKGINFPTLDVGLSGLTNKDKRDLEFVAQYADIVNFSFVNSEKDVEELLEEMQRLGIKDKVSVVLKIETRLAYRNLVKILMTAMQTQHVGVMIARGDLALEVGWKNMGKVQEEILSICGAAHIPVVWATQVLEGLAKKGVPSRSEITDITASVRAECVMLNKGPYINEAIVLLDEILGNMEQLRSKNEGMWPKIDWL